VKQNVNKRNISRAQLETIVNMLATAPETQLSLELKHFFISISDNMENYSDKMLFESIDCVIRRDFRERSNFVAAMCDLNELYEKPKK